MKRNILFVFSIVLFALALACSKEYEASAENQILSFSIGDFLSSSEGEIDHTTKTVVLQSKEGVDITKLVPMIKISDKATISPPIGVAQDFTNPVNYTVTAENGTKQVYIVKVLPPKSSQKTILSFNFKGLNPEVVGEVSQNNKSVLLKVPFGTNVKNLLPTVKYSEKASLSPVANIAQDFSKPVVYTVTAEDGSTQTYTVTVVAEKRKEKKITGFRFGSLSPSVEAVVDEGSRQITATLPSGTDISALAPSISISAGAQVVPESEVKQNFSKPVVYTVTAEDGSTQAYTVTVVVENSKEARIFDFAFKNLNQSGVIDEANKTIVVKVPYGTDVASLVPTITFSRNATITPKSGEKTNFYNPVTYKVVSESGSIEFYKVTVESEPFKTNISKVSRTELEARDVLYIEGTFIKGKTSVELVGSSTIKLFLAEESDSKLKVELPEKIEEGIYALSVTSNNSNAKYNSIKIKAPTKPIIDRVSVIYAVEDDELIIYGKNFNQKADKILLHVEKDGYAFCTIGDVKVNDNGTEARVVVKSNSITRAFNTVSARLEFYVSTYSYLSSNYINFNIVKKPTMSEVNVFVDYIDVRGVNLSYGNTKVWMENIKTSEIIIIPTSGFTVYNGSELLRIKNNDFPQGEYNLHILTCGKDIYKTITITRAKTIIDEKMIYKNGKIKVTGQNIYRDTYAYIDGKECKVEYENHGSMSIVVPSNLSLSSRSILRIYVWNSILQKREEVCSVELKKLYYE